jgi:hypothetical protein
LGVSESTYSVEQLKAVVVVGREASKEGKKEGNPCFSGNKILLLWCLFSPPTLVQKDWRILSLLEF